MTYPEMPFEIDDLVYFIDRASEQGGLPAYRITKLICCGYYNFGDGWKIKLRTNRNKYKYMEHNIFVNEAGYTLFTSRKEAVKRIRDLNAVVIE